MKVNRFPDRKITSNQNDYLYFSGTSYLGMATNQEFVKLLSKHLQIWGTQYGSSRNANVKLSIFEEFETFFSNYITAESCISVSSGTLAGHIAIKALTNNENVFFHYPKTHPAIIAEGSLPLFVDNVLHPKLSDAQTKHIVITLDAVGSGEVTPTSLSFLDNILKDKHITLLIDESHSIGITGNRGRGVFSSITHPNINRKVFVSSLSKALGLVGGVIASDADFIGSITKSNLFTSSSPASPAYLATFLNAQDIYQKQYDKLAKNLAFLHKHLQPQPEITLDVRYPVIYSDNDCIFTKMLDAGIVITSFKYPTYPKPMNRIVITANHTENDLKTLLNILNND